MRPKDIVNQLRHIASKIENSSRPSKELVSRDIRSVLAAMNEPTKIVDDDGTIEYRLNGKLHRTDGPAVEYSNGDKHWYINEKLHRTDGPAIERADGGKFWYVNDMLHRTDGPAIERANGTKEWWIDGDRVSVKNYRRFRSKYPELIKQFMKYEDPV